MGLVWTGVSLRVTIRLMNMERTGVLCGAERRGEEEREGGKS